MTDRTVVVNRFGPFGPFDSGHNPGKVVPAVGELLDQHLPVAHVHVLDDQLVAEDRPPGHVHEDALGLEKRAVGRLAALR